MVEVLGACLLARSGAMKAVRVRGRVGLAAAGYSTGLRYVGHSQVDWRAAVLRPRPEQVLVPTSSAHGLRPAGSGLSDRADSSASGQPSPVQQNVRVPCPDGLGRTQADLGAAESGLVRGRRPRIAGRAAVGSPAGPPRPGIRSSSCRPGERERGGGREGHLERRGGYLNHGLGALSPRPGPSGARRGRGGAALTAHTSHGLRRSE